MAKDPTFSALRLDWYGTEVFGSTVGIIGMGDVGSAIARRAAGFDMKVLYHNRKRTTPEAEAAAGNATYMPVMDDLLAAADFVVLACPATPETRHLMSTKQFATMKRSAILVNVARGSVVDQAALDYALRNGVIHGAGLDVTEPEPLPRDHPLLGAPNLVITPHVGTLTLGTKQTQLRMVRVVCYPRPLPAFAFALVLLRPRTPVRRRPYKTSLRDWRARHCRTQLVVLPLPLLLLLLLLLLRRSNAPPGVMLDL